MPPIKCHGRRVIIRTGQPSPIIFGLKAPSAANESHPPKVETGELQPAADLSRALNTGDV